MPALWSFQEWIFSLKGFQPFGWYLTLVQFACYGIFGIIESNWRREFNRKLVCDFLHLRNITLFCAMIIKMLRTSPI
jgi:hypothetical protein